MSSAREVLERLRAFLQRHGLPVGPVLIADGRLWIHLRSRPGRTLRVHLGPRGARAPFRQVGELALGYEGAPSLEELEPAWVDLVVALLSRSAASLPALLQRPAAVGLEELPLVEALPLEFPFCSVEEREVPGDPVPHLEILVRLTTRCNQDCPFCSAPPAREDPSAAQVLALVDRVLDSGRQALFSLTGGEPTLRGDLPELLRRALVSPRVTEIQVQTNAVMLAGPERLADFPRDPRLRFFVSLHAVDEAIYDRMTGSRGQLARALTGIRQILAAGYALILNTVVSKDNVGHLEELVAAVPALFPEGRPMLHFSVTMCPEHRERAPEVLVRYSELAPRLLAALAVADRLGVDHAPLLSSTHASIPACLVPEAAAQDPPAHRPRLGAHETGYEDMGKLWVKAARCRDCRMDPWCLGLPRPYVRRFGLDELAPLPPPAVHAKREPPEEELDR